MSKEVFPYYIVSDNMEFTVLEETKDGRLHVRYWDNKKGIFVYKKLFPSKINADVLKPKKRRRHVTAEESNILHRATVASSDIIDEGSMVDEDHDKKRRP